MNIQTILGDDQSLCGLVSIFYLTGHLNLVIVTIDSLGCTVLSLITCRQYVSGFATSHFLYFFGDVFFGHILHEHARHLEVFS